MLDSNSSKHWQVCLGVVNSVRYLTLVRRGMLSKLRQRTLAELFLQVAGSSPVTAKICYSLLFRELQIEAH